jgi:hypothetical protein
LPHSDAEQVQFPVSKLSKECDKERKAKRRSDVTRARQLLEGPKAADSGPRCGTGTATAADWASRPRPRDLPEADADEVSHLKRRKRFEAKMIARVIELSPE